MCYSLQCLTVAAQNYNRQRRHLNALKSNSYILLGFTAFYLTYTTYVGFLTE